MSISRLLHEFRPLFRILEDPLMRAPIAYGFPRRPGSHLADPFFTPFNTVHPALDLTEEGDVYVVEADLPGVKKVNVDITVGDGGRSVTIHGKTQSHRPAETIEPAAVESSVSQGEGAGAVRLTPGTPSLNQLTTERLSSGTSSFMRTIWLPQPIDTSKVTAKLVDGVLTLKAPKMEDKESVKINVD